MPVDISIISAGADTTGFLPYIRNHIHSHQNDAPNPVEVASVPEMVNAMLERCGRERHSIRAVRIFGHGARAVNLSAAAIRSRCLTRKSSG